MSGYGIGPKGYISDANETAFPQALEGIASGAAERPEDRAIRAAIAAIDARDGWPKQDGDPGIAAAAQRLTDLGFEHDGWDILDLVGEVLAAADEARRG